MLLLISVIVASVLLEKELDLENPDLGYPVSNKQSQRPSLLLVGISLKHKLKLINVGKRQKHFKKQMKNDN